MRAHIDGKAAAVQMTCERVQMEDECGSEDQRMCSVRTFVDRTTGATCATMDQVFLGEHVVDNKRGRDKKEKGHLETIVFVLSGEEETKKRKAENMNDNGDKNKTSKSTNM